MNLVKIGIGISLVLLIILVYWRIFGSGLTINNKCHELECKKSADMLLKSMNKSVDPCEDFYAFACGSYTKNADISYLNSADMVENMMLENISSYLEEKILSTDPKSLHQAKMLYRQCMDISNRENETFNSIARVLQQVGLPILPPIHKASTNFSLVKSMIRSELVHKMTFFMNIKFSPYSETIYLQKPGGPSSLSFMNPYKSSGPLKYEIPKTTFQEKILHQLPSVMESIISQIDDDFTEFRNYAQNVFRFVYDSQNETWSNLTDLRIIDELRITESYLFTLMTMSFSYDWIINSDPKSDYISISHLQEITDKIWPQNSSIPKIDWKEYFTLLLEDIPNTTTNVDNLNEEEKIKVFFNDKYYLTWVLRWLANNVTLQHIELYMWWMTVTNLASYTSTKISTYRSEYQGYGKWSRNQCASKVNDVFQYATAFMLVNNTDAKKDNEEAQFWADHIRAMNQRIINETDWMDNKSKARYMSKAQNLTTCIGFPSWISNSQELDKYYENYGYLEVNLNESDFLESLLNLHQARRSRRESKYELNFESSSGGEQKCHYFKPFQVNAYYDIVGNTLVIPTGYLQFPAYMRGLPSLALGTIGFAIAHEAGHAFSTFGILFHHRGYPYSSFLDNNTKAEYFRRMECLVNFYDNFNETGFPSQQSLGAEFDIGEPPEDYKHLNWARNLALTRGRRTLNENFSDVVGLKTAFRVLKRHLETNGTESVLPGLEEYSSEQLFFLSYANTECLRNYQDYIYGGDIDVHSSNPIRVWGALKNSEEFAEAFKCKKGTPMNPEEKCQIW